MDGDNDGTVMGMLTGDIWGWMDDDDDDDNDAYNDDTDDDVVVDGYRWRHGIKTKIKILSKTKQHVIYVGRLLILSSHPRANSVHSDRTGQDRTG